MEFESWIQEDVSWLGYTVSREQAIRRFVYKGLHPWLESLGYTWSCSRKELGNRIATGLFENQGKPHLESKWPGPDAPEGAMPEMEDHFHAILSPEAWEAFWANWGVWGDVHPDEFRGPDRRMDVEWFVWGQVNLETSPQTDAVLELLGATLEEDEEMTPALRQSYEAFLQESVEYNGWGGYRR